jgi:hypothetical protein
VSGRAWIWGLLAAISVGALGGLLAVPASTVVVEQQVNRGEELATLGKGRVGQTFRSQTSGLTQIDFVMTSRERPAPAARFQLRELPDDVGLVDRLLPTRLPGGHEYLQVPFTPPVDSEGRTYEFSVERDRPLEPGHA